ncbi:aldehyde dehydrogenase family protein [Streptomyces sp. NPDC047974]|uniref:aldehyde dehydrogenase family protein n=1 Tax=Streptomyces sp. NPDC047974 TaxID=3154343 RepID=UPI0033C771CB
MTTSACEPPPPHLLRNFTGGAWTRAESGVVRANVNPADASDVIGEFPESGGVDVEHAVGVAADAFAAWQALDPVRRAGHLACAARLLEERADRFAVAITREQGKLLVEARAEVHGAVAALDFVAGEARRLERTAVPTVDDRTSAFSFRRPIGVVGLITTWHLPLATPVRKLAPALLAGCTVVLKPSPLAPLTPALLAEVLHEAGVPPGVFNLVQGDAAAGEALVDHPSVAGVGFTGSRRVAAAVHRAGSGRLLRTELDLAGKDTVVVLDDADLDKAVAAVAAGAFGQAGQRYGAVGRVVVDRRVRREFLARLLPRVASLRLGPGMDPRSEMGPLVDEEHVHACLEAVAKVRAGGAELLSGGDRAAGGPLGGRYVRPTVLAGDLFAVETAVEEVFGPVVGLVEADGPDEAVRLVGNVRTAMSVAVFTTSRTRALEAVERLDASAVHVNRPAVAAYVPHADAKGAWCGPTEFASRMWDLSTEWRSARVTL